MILQEKGHLLVRTLGSVPIVATHPLAFNALLATTGTLASVRTQAGRHCLTQVSMSSNQLIHSSLLL